MVCEVRAYFEAEDFGLDEVEGFAVDFDEALAFLAVGDCCRWEVVSLFAWIGWGRRH
jgi:hypothetical protein